MDKLTLHSALNQLQTLNAAIRLTPKSVAIWCPGHTVPRIVRSTIQEHKAEVRQMLLDSKIEVCPSVPQHRQEWYYPLQEWIAGSAVCGACQRLAYIGNPVVANRSNFEKIKVTVKVESSHA